MLVFEEGGKPENPEKSPQSRDENQQQTQPTYEVESGNQMIGVICEGLISHQVKRKNTPTCTCTKSMTFLQAILNVVTKYPTANENLVLKDLPTLLLT